MSHIMIFHGVEGYPEENWFPWLKAELELLGHTVDVPQFPTPEHQTIDNWLPILDRYTITPETIIVAHSLGVAFALNVIERMPVKAAYLVAGFIGKAGNEYDDSMATFAQREFDWEAIHRNCNHFEVFHSENDPYVGIEKAHELSNALHIQPHIIAGAGHFNTQSGYKQFPELLSLLQPELTN